MRMGEEMDVETVLREYEEQLMQLPNVTGVGVGEKEGTDVIIVFVTHKVPESDLRPQDVISKTLEGYETDVKIQVRVGTG